MLAGFEVHAREVDENLQVVRRQGFERLGVGRYGNVHRGRTDLVEARVAGRLQDVHRHLVEGARLHAGLESRHVLRLVLNGEDCIPDHSCQHEREELQPEVMGYETLHRHDSTTFSMGPGWEMFEQPLANAHAKGFRAASADHHRGEE